jgi:hypothetical protein
MAGDALTNMAKLSTFTCFLRLYTAHQVEAKFANMLPEIAPIHLNKASWRQKSCKLTSFPM